MEITTIKISKELKGQLKELGNFGQSYEDIVRMLYNHYMGIPKKRRGG